MRRASRTARPDAGTAAARAAVRQLRLAEAAPAGAPAAPPFELGPDWRVSDDGLLAVFDGRDDGWHVRPRGHR